MNNKKSKRKRRVPGARTYRDYSEDMLALAVEMVEKKTMSSRDAEKRFGIPRRTILNKIKKLHMKPAGGQKKLSNEEEEKLVKVLIASSDYGSPMSKTDLKILVYKYVEKNSQTDLFDGKLPSDTWVDGFLNGHCSKLTIRATQNIKKVRAEKGLDEMESFFDNLRETLKDVPPTNILNYDETNLSDNPGTSKCLFRRGVKHPERIINSTKSCISLMFTASAAGTCLPTYVVYKSTNIYSEWVEGGPDGTRYNCSKSGWFDTASFEDYFKTIVVEWAKQNPGPKVVIGDNLSSHINVEVVELCQIHNIRLVFLPPNSTHLTQPLDVAYFGPLKREWKKILLEYKFKNPGQSTLNKKHFPKLLAQLLDSIKHRESNNITSGFRATGIWPVNPRNVFKRIPEYFDDTEYGIDTVLLDYLKETRAPNPLQVKRSKKLRTEPGKSVCASDILTKTNITQTARKKTSKKDATTENRVADCDLLKETLDTNQEIETNEQNQSKASKKLKKRQSTKNQKPNKKTDIAKNRTDSDNDEEEETDIIFEKMTDLGMNESVEEIYLLNENTGKMTRNFYNRNATTETVNYYNNNTEEETEIYILDNIEKIDEIEKMKTLDKEGELDVLDEITGEVSKRKEITKKVEYDMPLRSIGNISCKNLASLPPLEPVTCNPDKLDRLCIKFINTYLGLPTQDNTHYGSSDVSILHTWFKNDEQNRSFMAMNDNDLPKCLQPKTSLQKLTASSKKLTANKTLKSKVIITSDVKVTAEEMKHIRKNMTVETAVITPSALQLTLVTPKMEKYHTPKGDQGENLNTLNEKNTRKRKKNTARTKNDCGKMKKLDTEKRIKTEKKTVKRKKLRTYSETSSENFDTMNLADSDQSDYETYDDYISTCLKEMDDKENYEPDDITVPFGLSDINYFNGVVDLNKDDWVVVKFTTKKSLKHYVGRILSVNNSVPTVKFVRKVKNSKGGKVIFTYPNVEDICEVNSDDVVIVLPQPNISRRGQIMFDTEFSPSYNIQ